MNRLPLITGTPERIVAFGPEGPATVAQFLADVAQLAESLPDGRHLLNICNDRYHFMVGLAAGLVSDRLTVLPTTQTPEAIRQLQQFAPDVFCLHDGNGESVELPLVRYPLTPAVRKHMDQPVPWIDADRNIGFLFTSGSTGVPVPHRRTWGAAVRASHAVASRLGLTDAGFSVVGTVPAQHSFGLEATILLALHGHVATAASRPFYPADIAAALAAVPRPRLLVTTPFHLRSLLDSGVDMPTLDLVLSATAPLSQELALKAERQLDAPLHEIYGCTEAGPVASRRTAESLEWEPLPDVIVRAEENGYVAFGGHVEERVALSDRLELVESGRFLLHGRNADLINIAGKRTSLAYLNHQLNAISGIQDGCFFLPDEDSALPVEHVSRLCAFVVAPELTTGQVLNALRDRIDPAFLPRPLVFVDSLKRNPTGKLLRSELQALYKNHVTPTADKTR